MTLPLPAERGHAALDTSDTLDARIALRVVQLSSDFVLVVDADSGQAVEINGQLRAVLGLAADAPPSQLDARVHPDDLAALIAQRRRAAALPDGATLYAEYRLRRNDGRWCWLRERSTVLQRLADGRPQLLLGVARDITREMQVQQSIDADAQRFALALSASGVVVFSHDRELRYTWIHNPALGLQAQQMLGRRDSELMERPDEGRALERIKQRAMDERRRVVEEICVHAQGQPSWWRLTVEPVIDRSGGVTGVTCAAYEITQQLKADAERASDLARLDALIGNAPVAIAFVDHEFRHLRVNGRAYEWAGLAHESQMLGRTVEQVIPGLWPQIGPLYRKVRDEGATFADIEVSGPVGDSGVRRTFLCNYFPVPLAEGRRGVGLVITDITERKQTEQELVAAKQRGDEANAAKDRFLATLSHELRTPLTPILLSARILELKPDDRETVLGRAEVIRRSVETEVRLIDDLLDLTRISRDKIGLAAAPVSLHEVAIEAVEVCEHDAQAARVEVELKLDAPQHLVKGDAQRLQQVLWNLLRNAIKFSPPGSRVTVTTDNPDRQTVRLAVRDRGIGIAAADLPRLFQPFEQGDARITRQFGGLGLGLAIVQRLVALHGGQVRAESDGPDLGACFVITLPLLPARAAPAVGVATPPRMTARASGRVLVVEDHVDTAQTLGTLLAAAGWQVTAADTAAAAAEAVRAQRFDLVLSDLSLPDGDGCDLLQLLRQQGCEAPAIAMTGHGMDADQERTQRAGFLRHFVKPVEVSQLLASMDVLASQGGAAAAR